MPNTATDTPPTCCIIPAGQMTITPALAEHWLENHNKVNRHPSKKIIAKYADLMRQGRWLLTHQGIAFDQNGHLIDGQHRLAAIVLAGMSVTMQVTTGMDPDTFAVLDNGFRRQAAHLIDHPSRKIMASAARIIGPVTGAMRSSSRVTGGIYANSAENDEIIALVNDWPELATYASLTVRCYQTRSINASVHLAVVAMASRTQYGDRLPDWFDGLIGLANLAPTDPRLLLASRFMAARERRMLNSANGKVPAYHLVVKAWNAHALGRPVGVLRYREVEGPPEIVN